MYYTFTLCLSLLSLSSCMTFLNHNDWAIQDLNFIYKTIKENHPGTYNTLDPDFNKNLTLNYKQAKQQLLGAQSDGSKEKTLKNFSASFNDTHLGINFDNNQPKIIPLQTQQFTEEQLSPNIHWVTLPTFEPNKEQQNDLNRIISKLPQWRDAQTIIFDIRGNQGGNSTWERNIISALFGKTYACHHINKHNKSVTIDWRASQDNLAHIQHIKNQNLEQFGASSEFIQELDTIITGMQSAQSNNNMLFTQTESSTCQTSDITENPVTANIIVITHDHNVSAALDFIDDLKSMQHPITLLGQATSADSLYMECRTIELPSKRGNLYIPIKVYRNRTRGHNEPYTPDIIWHGNIRDTKKIQQFTLNYINQSDTISKSIDRIENTGIEKW